MTLRLSRPSFEALPGGHLAAAATALDLAAGPAPDGNGRLWLSGFINALRDAWAAVEVHTADVESGRGPLPSPAELPGRMARALEAHQAEHEEMRRKIQLLLRDATEVEWREPSQVAALRLRGIHVRELIWSHHTRTAELAFEATHRDLGGQG